MADETNNPKKEKKYRSNFKSLKLDESGQMTIGIVQANFETFWRQLNKIDGSQNAKTQCLNKLREACHWMSRGVAEYHEVEDKEDH